MPGPLPNPQRRRRNAPTIPTTNLPAAGRTGPIPKPPKAYALSTAGVAWWRWAWRTPQSAGWSTGDLYVVARRARLEDDLAALDRLDAHHLDLASFLDIDADERTEVVEGLIACLKRLAGGELSLIREAREIDDRLGLTPKGFASLRWTIKAEEEPRPEAQRGSNVRRLRAVDSGALAGA